MVHYGKPISIKSIEKLYDYHKTLPKIYFLNIFHFEQIVRSHTVVRNNVE